MDNIYCICTRSCIKKLYKNYEIYSYSNSAGDVFHYSIGKHYDFLNINDIIHITYNEQNEVKKYDYDNYLKKHKCRLVGGINESK